MKGIFFDLFLRRMKKMMCLLVLLIGFHFSVFSQAKSPEAKAQSKTALMSNKLSLSPQQVNLLSALHLKSYTLLAQAEKQCAGDKDCYKKKKKTIKADREAAYKKILTPGQWKQWVAIKEQDDKEKVDKPTVTSPPKNPTKK